MGNDPGPVGQVHNFSPAALIDPGGTAWEVWGAGSMASGAASAASKKSTDRRSNVPKPVLNPVNFFFEPVKNTFYLVFHEGKRTDNPIFDFRGQLNKCVF